MLSALNEASVLSNRAAARHAGRGALRPQGRFIPFNEKALETGRNSAGEWMKKRRK